MIWVIVRTILAFVMIGAVVYQGYRIVELKQEQYRIEKQLEELRQKNEQLEMDKARLQDPKQVEAVAREELGLVKPGEVPYVK